MFTVVDGQVRTPGLSVGILDGITRTKVLELCRVAGLPAQEVEFLAPDELRAANEVFLTSAVRAVLPVTRVDDRTIGDGTPGPVTRRLMGLFQAAAEAALGVGGRAP